MVSRDWRDLLATELSKARRLFVLGVGNPRKADDGAGCVCARLLQKKFGRRPVPGHPASLSSRNLLKRSQSPNQGAFKDIQILDAGEVPENATGIIRRFGPTHVLIVDAAAGGYEPGRVFIVDRRRIRREDLSTHRIPLIHLLRYLEQNMKCRVILVGIEPRVIAWNQPLSASVKAAADDLARTIFQNWTGLSSC